MSQGAGEVQGAPVCFSQYYVHKPGARCVRNCRELRDLHTRPSRLLAKKILHDARIPECELAALCGSLDELLTDLKNNFKMQSKLDFVEYFPVIKKRRNELEEVNKKYILDGCVDALMKILPSYFFGPSVNRKQFKKDVREIIYSMQGQHFMSHKFVEKWKTDSLPWSIPIPLKYQIKVLHNLLLWIYKYLLGGIISVNFYVTTTKCSYDERKLYYYPKNHWQSFQDQKIKCLIDSAVITKYEPFCLSKTNRTKYSALERLKIKKAVKRIPKLYLVLKKDNNFRPIVRYKSKSKNDKNTLARRNLLKLFNGSTKTNIEIDYISMYEKWIEMQQPKLYFVKADLTDAFGSIDRNTLITILADCHKSYQQKEKNIDLKRKVAHQYRLLISDLRQPLLVRCGSTVYEWKYGLVQGLMFSPALSEIYYKHLDESYLSVLRTQSDGIQFFKRVVDDYLYISDSILAALNFLNDLSNYKNLNYSKTVINFLHPNIKEAFRIVFLGYQHDPSTLRVARSESVYSGQMCYKIAFTPAISNTYKFIENRIGQSGMPINALIFNLCYNDEDTLWSQIFMYFCLSANKFCTILAILSDEKDMCKYLTIYKRKVCVRLSNSIIETIIRNKPNCIQFEYCINHFRHLAYKALYLCARNTQNCSILILDIKKLLAKTNCMSGKWWDHASKIDCDGIQTQSAIKSICRRLEYRTALKNCDEMPKGFECYKSDWKYG